MIEILKKLLTIFHVSLFIIFTIGPFLPGKYLIYYLFLWPAVYIHWHFNDNNCMLTEIEYSMDQQYYNGLTEYIFHSKNGFFSILKKLHILFPNFESLNSWLDNYRSALWIIAFIRALIYYQKDIVNWVAGTKRHFITRFICDFCKG